MIKMLENDRIKLRALEPEDLEFLYKWENDTRLWEYGNTLSPFSRYVLHQYIENAHLDLYEAKQIRLIVEEKISGLAIGTVDLYDFEPFHSRAGIGILIDESYQNKTYAFITMNLIITYAFEYLKISQIYAFIPADNVPSLHLFRKLGFEESGHLKKWNKTTGGNTDVYIYQLLA